MTTQDHDKLSTHQQNIVFSQFMKDMSDTRTEVKSPFQFMSWLRVQDNNRVRSIIEKFNQPKHN
jgi:hypothetical protein